MDPLVDILTVQGPCRSSLAAKYLQEKHGLSATAARQRISRAAKPIVKFPVPLLPKREAFLYLLKDRNSERFWNNFLRDLRETNSVYGAAIDGLLARGGTVRKDEFAVISGAPIAQKGQVAAERVAERLIAAGFMTRVDIPDNVYTIAYSIGPTVGTTDLRPRDLAEKVMLDAVREWARKLGMASYNSIAVRGDDHLRQVGPFVWDMTGPSYLLPLRSGEAQPGFLVADVFADGVLDEFNIRYFIRKAQMSKAALKGAGVFPLLVAEGFTGAALTYGHRAGVVMATPATLFGNRVASALRGLLDTLQNAAAMVSGNPAKLESLIQELTAIEGAAGSLRGILFHLLCAHLARRDAKSIDIGIPAYADGKSADIDILKIEHQSATCTLIECKGKNPGGILQVDEVETWLSRLPTFNGYLRNHMFLREAKRTFEIWTSGTFSAEALEVLKREKAARTRYPIDWKDGSQILELARAGKEKAITDSLYEHFLRHPLSETAVAPNAAA